MAALHIHRQGPAAAPDLSSTGPTPSTYDALTLEAWRARGVKKTGRTLETIKTCMEVSDAVN
jgi:hypothetical protein